MTGQEGLALNFQCHDHCGRARAPVVVPSTTTRAGYAAPMGSRMTTVVPPAGGQSTAI